MITPKIRTLTYFEWSEVTEEVERVTGKQVRNWANKSWSPTDPNYTNEYQDFWHEMIDYIHNFSNGCYATIDFQDAIEYYTINRPIPWVADILKIYHTVVGIDEATFHIWW